MKIMNKDLAKTFNIVFPLLIKERNIMNKKHINKHCRIDITDQEIRKVAKTAPSVQHLFYLLGYANPEHVGSNTYKRCMRVLGRKFWHMKTAHDVWVSRPWK